MMPAASLPTFAKTAKVGHPPGSSADDAGIRSGDIITEVNRHPVASASDVQQQLGSVPKGKDALVLVWSNGASTFRVLHAPEAGQGTTGF